jgi:hypothetical protein
MLKRLAILAGTLAVFGSNVALAEPTLELGGPNASAPARAETAPPQTSEETAPSGPTEGTAPARTSVLPHTVTPQSYNWNA